MLLSLLLGIKNKYKIDNLEKQAAQEASKTNFVINKLSNGEILYDSCYIKKDTLFFYKDGKLIGSSFTKTETKNFFTLQN